MSAMNRYKRLRAEVQRLQGSTANSTRLSHEERADWAFGNAVISNERVTREMVERARRNTVIWGIDG